MELVKTSRPLAAILGHSLCTKRTAKIGFGLIAAVFLLQFYYVRELVFMEAVLASSDSEASAAERWPAAWKAGRPHFARWRVLSDGLHISGRFLLPGGTPVLRS